MNLHFYPVKFHIPKNAFPPNVSRETRSHFEEYIQLIMKWNKKVNLTGSKSAEAFFTDHVIDCWMAQHDLKPEQLWIDVGSGAGLPGIIWAIVRPEEEFVLVEALKKRAGFLQRVISSLELKNVKVLSVRFEEILEQKSLFPTKKACIVSRGTAAAEKIIKYARNISFPWNKWFIFSTSYSHQLFLSAKDSDLFKIYKKKYSQLPAESNEKEILTVLELI